MDRIETIMYNRVGIFEVDTKELLLLLLMAWYPRAMLECLDHSPAGSPHPSMQTAVFYAVSSLPCSHSFHLMFAS